MSRTILCTGTAGFIGYHVAKALLMRGDRVVGIDNMNDYYDVGLKEARRELLVSAGDFITYKDDISDLSVIEAMFSKYDFDAVCHLAAQAGVRHSIEDPFAYEKSNCTGFLNVIDTVAKRQVENFVYASSSSASDYPSSFYGATKRYNELTAYAYKRIHGLSCTGLRFFTVYGPWGRPDMALWKFTEAILDGRPIDVYGNGRMSRDFTYIDDIVSGVIAAIDRPSHYSAVWDLGRSERVALEDFITIIETELGVKAERNYLPMQPGDVDASLSDIQDARIALGYDPKVSIEEGVRRFVEWFGAYKETV